MHLLLAGKLDLDDLVRNGVIALGRDPRDVTARARRHQHLVLHQRVLRHDGVDVARRHAVAHLAMVEHSALNYVVHDVSAATAH